MLDPMLSPTHTHSQQENKNLCASNLTPGRKQQQNEKLSSSNLTVGTSNSKNT